MSFKPVKISKLVNPFSHFNSDSEANNDSLTSSNFLQGLKASNVQPTFPNIFRYNERQKILISDSSYQDSSYDHGQKHQATYDKKQTYQISKQSQKQAQVKIPQQVNNNKTTKMNTNTNFNQNINSAHQRIQSQIQKPSVLESTKGQNLTRSSKQYENSLEAPQINKFVLNPQQQQGKQSKISQNSGADSTKTKYLHPQYVYTYKSYSNSLAQKKSVPNNIHKKEQPILDEDIEIVDFPQVNETFQKDLIMQKLQLSKGSQVHSITQSILQNLNNQNAQEQIQIQSKSPSIFNESQKQEKQKLHNSYTPQTPKPKLHKEKEKQPFIIYQSKLVQESQSEKFDHTDKNQTQKRKRKKIFDKKSTTTHVVRSAYVHSSSHPQHDEVHISKFTQKDLHYRCPHTECLLKSLEIIQKMVPQKQSQNSNSKSKQSFRKSQKLNHNHSLSTIKQKQQFLQISQRIIQINFQIKSIQSVFGIQSFQSSNMIAKMNWLQQASIQLFKHIKINKITSQKIVNQIMSIYQKIQKMVRCYERYCQIKQKLSVIQKQVKDILMLDLPQKYKKTKLISQMVDFLDQAEWSLSQENMKEYSQISQCLRNYIHKQKGLLVQLLKWLKAPLKK